MIEIRSTSDLPEDDATRQDIERARTQVETLKAAMDFNFLTVQMLRDEDGVDETRLALVAHNPCNLSQYHLVAFLPTLDTSLEVMKMNEAARDQIAKMEEEMPKSMESTIFELCMKRFSHAAHSDPEGFVRITNADTFEEARKVYQEHYGLVGGGDFNHPLK